MICNVFVCNVWKHGGVFSSIGDQIQCGETSVNDNYRLQLYSGEPVPGLAATFREVPLTALVVTQLCARRPTPTTLCAS